MNPFRLCALLVSVFYSTARVAFAVVEIVCDSADWAIGRAEAKWKAWKWDGLGKLARIVFTDRELR
jgi:hypothetical protein